MNKIEKALYQEAYENKITGVTPYFVPGGVNVTPTKEFGEGETAGDIVFPHTGEVWRLKDVYDSDLPIIAEMAFTHHLSGCLLVRAEFWAPLCPFAKGADVPHGLLGEVREAIRGVLAQRGIATKVEVSIQE